MTIKDMKVTMKNMKVIPALKSAKNFRNIHDRFNSIAIQLNSVLESLTVLERLYDNGDIEKSPNTFKLIDSFVKVDRFLETIQELAACSEEQMNISKAGKTLIEKIDWARKNNIDKDGLIKYIDELYETN